MPIKKFWAFNSVCERLQAADDRRMLHLLGAVTNQESFTKLNEHLTERAGEIYVFQPVARTLVVDDPATPDPGLDREGLESLRAHIMRNGK
ncbi:MULTISPECIES: hypothetical protein [unclassified Ensifer]|uniref:hypothetical protein n=1 Tax=unclassified Ensifer TaxID=2633371 RepID=UPI0011473969|nr:MULTISPECIES: hypothetical protein [unclassified Ensifer]